MPNPDCRPVRGHGAAAYRVANANGPPDTETLDRRRADPPAGCRAAAEPAICLNGGPSLFPLSVPDPIAATLAVVERPKPARPEGWMLQMAKTRRSARVAGDRGLGPRLPGSAAPVGTAKAFEVSRSRPAGRPPSARPTCFDDADRAPGHEPREKRKTPPRAGGWPAAVQASQDRSRLGPRRVPANAFRQCRADPDVPILSERPMSSRPPHRHRRPWF
jgi:hypothetical protein